jgi:hypothetical protein
VGDVVKGGVNRHAPYLAKHAPVKMRQKRSKMRQLGAFKFFQTAPILST